MKLPLHLSRTLAAWQVAAALILAGGGAAFAVSPVFSSNNTVSDILGVAHETDPLLVNPWGLAIRYDNGNLHVSDDGSGFATVYEPNGTSITGTVGITIPSVSGTVPGSPTGVVENEAAFIIKTDTNDFDISANGKTAPAHFIYGTEDGEIVGYRDTVDSTNGIVEYTSTTGAGYTGVALAWTGTTNTELHHHLYAANFAQGTIDVFDASFNPVTLTGTFAPPADPGVPPLPADAPAGSAWSPFNIKAVDFNGPDPLPPHHIALQRRLLVAYALHSSTNAVLNDIPGEHHGYVDIFFPDGTWAGRIVGAASASLNSPWGMAVSHHPFAGLPAPAALLVGNHGDGTIRAYAFEPGYVGNGFPFGELQRDKLGNPLAFDGLWALKFGVITPSEREYEANHAILDEINKDLNFTAGIVSETHGLAGQILVP